MLLAINLNFVIFSIYLYNIIGYVLVLFISIIGATKFVVRVTILIIYYRLKILLK